MSVTISWHWRGEQLSLPFSLPFFTSFSLNFSHYYLFMSGTIMWPTHGRGYAELNCVCTLVYMYIQHDISKYLCPQALSSGRISDRQAAATDENGRLPLLVAAGGAAPGQPEATGWRLLPDPRPIPRTPGEGLVSDNAAITGTKRVNEKKKCFCE